MRKVISGGLVAAALGTALIVAGAFPASAQVARPQSALATGESNGELLTLVQNRGRGRGDRVARRGGGRSANVGFRARSNRYANISRASRSSIRVARFHRGDRYRQRWHDNWRWRHHRDAWRYRHWGSGFAFGVGLGVPYYAYRPAYYAYTPTYYAYPTYAGSAVAYCMSRFRSYDPVSRTYLGFDGFRHPCP